MNLSDLKQRRVDLGLTQREFAERCKKPLLTYQRWESGQSVPHPGNLRLLQQVLGELRRERLLGVVVTYETLGRALRDELVSAAAHHSAEIHYYLGDHFLSDLGALHERRFKELLALARESTRTLDYVEPDSAGDERHDAAARKFTKTLEATTLIFDPDRSRRNADLAEKLEAQDERLRASHPDGDDHLLELKVTPYLEAKEPKKGRALAVKRFGESRVAKVEARIEAHKAEVKTEPRAGSTRAPQRGRSRQPRTSSTRTRGSRRSTGTDGGGGDDSGGDADPEPPCTSCSCRRSRAAKAGVRS